MTVLQTVQCTSLLEYYVRDIAHGWHFCSPAEVKALKARAREQLSMHANKKRRKNHSSVEGLTSPESQDFKVLAICTLYTILAVCTVSSVQEL